MTAIPVREHTLDLIGNTPLVRLEGPSAEAGCDIFGKCEFANPGASVKDRAALYIIRDAEERGELKPGGTVVEGTAGNTGIGIALVANALGYRTIIVMPDNQSKEKMDTLRALGAELVTVPPTKYADSNHFQHVSRRMAEELDGAVWAGQFDNTANRKAHIETTARELWDQLEGRIDGFTCAAGTGGTIAGVGMGLKELDETVTIALTDPHGAALYNYFANGELKAEGSSVAEGIGQGRITGNLEGAPKKVCALACPRASMSPARSRWASIWSPKGARIRASPPSCATPASAISRRFTAPNGWPRRACRCSIGCKAAIDCCPGVPRFGACTNSST